MKYFIFCTLLFYILMFDQMALTPGLHYSRKLDVIKSVPDTGSSRTINITDHALIFLNKENQSCQRSGLNGIATVCDQDSANSAGFNASIKDGREYCVYTEIVDKYDFLSTMKMSFPCIMFHIYLRESGTIYQLKV